MSASVKNAAMRHVPELDGLRGIAIIPVLIHHQLTPFSLRGGFLGVDLFFVLSGFLITGLLLAEFEKTGSISIRNFYMRRVLRLGPALALFLLVSLLVTYHTQLIGVARQLKLIAMALLYSANWRMAFGWDPVLDPTVIIWSLSIEEQFYLAWPLLLFGCLALRLKGHFIATGLILVIFGIVVHRNLLLDSGADLTRLYYGTDTRADALMMGCLVAFLPWAGSGLRARRLLGVASVFATACLLLLMSAISFDDRWLYRGGFTLIAAMAGIVIYVAANSPPRLLSVALQFNPLRWFGRISYGLYLWHWLVVRTASFYYLGSWEPWAKLGLAVGIASASFYLVERPFNRMKSRFTVRGTGEQPDSFNLPECIPETTMSPLGIKLAN